MKSSTCLVTALLALTSFGSVSPLPVPSSPLQTAKYVCPKCGCGKDGVKFDKPGECPDCQMRLVTEDTPPPPKSPSILDEHHDLSSTEKRSVTRLANGVYEIRHPDAPDNFPQSNTLVVIGSQSVLVVDSCYLPSAAKEDIADIRKWTKKPVKYLVNTHWHYDHTMGNGVYAVAFPGLQIIAQTETKKQCTGLNPYWFERYKSFIVKAQSKIDTGKDETGATLTEEQKKAAAEEVVSRTKVEAEFSKLKDAPPNSSFDTRLDLNLGGRRVQLLWLGRGNTLGDAVVYLPKESIAEVGDLVDHPVPYLGGGFPIDQPQTLERLVALNARIIVPGHGAVLHGSAYIKLLASYIRAVTTEVSRQAYVVGDSRLRFAEVDAAVKKSFPIDAWIKKFGLTDQNDIDFFRSFSFGSLIVATYADLSRR